MKTTLKKNYRLQIGVLIFLIVLIGIAMITIQYPRQMKDMFVQSSLESMQKQQNNAAMYINDNVSMNYDEIRMLAGMIAGELNGTEYYSSQLLSITKKAMQNAQFTNIGIIKKDSEHLFATMTDGSKVQLDTWTYVLDYGTNDISIELQTSPFKSADKGEDMVVYRYNFADKKGNEYMLIAEKPQNTLNSMLDLEAQTDGLTLVIRENGNMVYGKGMIDDTSVNSYNIYAMFRKFHATEEQIAEIKQQILNHTSGLFELKIDKENYYFMFHRIENTGWIVLNGYSETAMAGKNLARVNSSTLHVVMVIVFLLIMALIFSLHTVRSSMKRELDRRALETERLFEEMSSYIPISFAIVVPDKANPVFVSRNFYEILRESHFDFTLEGIQKWCGEAFTEERLKELKSEGKCEVIINKNELYFSFGIYSIGIVNDQDNYVLVFNDVTSDINSRKLLEDSMKRASEASKSKTAFLSRMSHEIRTPLNSVIGFSTLAMEGWNTLPNDELQDYVSKIRTSGNYLLELVSDILDVSRIEEGRMEISKSPCSLDAMIDEITDSFQGQMKRKNLQFIVDKNYEDVVLNMDSFHTKQIMNNLISNAYKYTEDDGVVGFEITANKLDEKKMGVQFVIQDTGIGMTPEFLNKIFEPFTQEDRGTAMKKQLRGSGLGMSICKNLVDMQDGTIKVESEIGEGSCFTVMLTFEIADEKLQKATLEAAKEQDYSCLQGKKILVVDDVEMNRIFVDKVLQNIDILTEDAADGQEAVDKFAASAVDEYFAIFMDVNMPVMNGYAATEMIRKMDRPDAKEIMIAGLTADAFSDDVNKALMSGMNYHISKPVDINRVKTVLMETYAKKQKKAEKEK